MSRNEKILLAFYGDDFTGSTDALEFISKAGARAVLFTDTPTQVQLDAFPGLNAFGIAGKTRSVSPAEMEDILIPAFTQLRSLGIEHIHYKVCSTFDSSPSLGSIGRAIDCAAKIFEASIIPVLGGMPALGRYCLFGNLFAQMGIGSNGKIYRLDRHPSMSKHPSTPAEESDLRLHLGKQTDKKIGLVDILQLEQPFDSWNTSLKDNDMVLIDVLKEEQLEKIGEWMDAQKSDHPLISVGSSGIEMALGKHWNKKGLLQPVAEWAHAGKASPLLVVSGSCSPVTAGQIAWALSNGFEEIILDVNVICNDGVMDDETIQKVSALLSQQKSVVVHTGNRQTAQLPADKLGAALGSVVMNAIGKPGIKRLVVSGGDTSSYAARALNIEAVEMIAPIISGAPLCKAYSRNKAVDGLQINFKGGQVGPENYFGLVLNGG